MLVITGFPGDSEGLDWEVKVIACPGRGAWGAKLKPAVGRVSWTVSGRVSSFVAPLLSVTRSLIVRSPAVAYERVVVALAPALIS